MSREGLTVLPESLTEPQSTGEETEKGQSV